MPRDPLLIKCVETKRSRDICVDICNILFFNSEKFPSTEANVAVSYGDLRKGRMTFIHKGNSLKILKICMNSNSGMKYALILSPLKCALALLSRLMLSMKIDF